MALAEAISIQAAETEATEVDVVGNVVAEGEVVGEVPDHGQ